MTAIPTATARQISEAEGKLVALFGEIRNTPTWERVQLWVAKMCGGRKLSEYLKAPDPTPSEKLMVVRALVDILLTKTYDRLPELTPMEPANVAAVARVPVPSPVASVRVIQPEAAPDESAPPQAFTPAQIAAIRAEVRRELAAVLATISKVLAE